MKCKIFTGEAGEVQVAFNNWAKGKQLTRDIIIHTQTHYLYDKSFKAIMSITVYFPEGSAWDKEEAPTIPPINTKYYEHPNVETEAIAP